MARILICGGGSIDKGSLLETMRKLYPQEKDIVVLGDGEVPPIEAVLEIKNLHLPELAMPKLIDGFERKARRRGQRRSRGKGF